MFRLEMTGEVAVIRLDVPPVNAMSFACWTQLPGLVRQAAEMGAAVLLIHGTPHKHFCAGNDVREFKDLTPADTLSGTASVRDAMKAVRESPLAVIAALHGAVMGSGLILACACDIRLATPDTRLALPEVKVDSYGGYTLLSELLPRGEARAMTLLGSPISGARAFELGLVQELAADAQAVLARAMALAEQMAQTLKGRLRQEIKTVMNRQDEQSTWVAYDLERDFASRIMGQAATL